MARLPDIPERSVLDAAFQPYIEGVGKVAHAWNHFQEELAQLFCIVAGLDNSVGLAIWHRLKNDRAQRDILDAAIISTATHETWSVAYPTALDDLKWLISKANTVADQRNDAIHAPCSLQLSFNEKGLEIIPFSFLGNPRANKLRDKEILKHLAWYERSADVLKGFAHDVQPPLMFPEHGHAWPTRPNIPALGDIQA